MSLLSVGDSRKAQERLDLETPLKEGDRKGKRRLRFEPRLLQGKKFYLDVPNVPLKKVQQLRGDLELLGAEVSDFLSKDITYLVSSRREACQNENATSNVSTPSPATPSPFQQKSSASHTRSPWMQSPQETDSPTSFDMKKPLPPSYNTRGKCFVQKAVATRHQGSTNLIATARKFNVKVRALDKVLEWIQSHKPMLENQSTPQPSTADMKTKRRYLTPSTPKVRILTSPFVKVEDISRTYKPQWACFDQWPVIDADCHAGMCPFDINRMDGDTQRRDGVTADKRQLKAARKRRGYCECCLEQFDDLSSHLKSRQHVEFANNAENYTKVDECIKQGVTVEQFLAKEWRSEEETQTTSQRQEREEDLSSEDRDDVRLISVRMSGSGRVASNSSWDGDLIEFVRNQSPQQFCDKLQVESRDQPSVGNTGGDKEQEAVEINVESRDEFEHASRDHPDTQSKANGDSRDSKTSGTFKGFSNSEVNQTIDEVMDSLNLLQQPEPDQKSEVQGKSTPKSRRRHKRDEKELLEHPQEKYLKQGLTNQERELTVSALLTGERNLRSKAVTPLAKQETETSSPIRATRKRTRMASTDEQIESSADFKTSPKWRRPATRKQPKRTAKFLR